MYDYLFNVALFSYKSVLMLTGVFILALITKPISRKSSFALYLLLVFFVIYSNATNSAITYKNAYDEKDDQYHLRQERLQTENRSRRLDQEIVTNSESIERLTREEREQQAQEAIDWRNE